jgi:hypothetical protein
MTAAATDPQMQQSALFDQAVETFEAALRAGIRVQEETFKCVTDAMSELGSPQDWQARAQRTIKETLPKLQKNAEEAVAAMNRSAKESLDLLNQAFEVAQVTNPEQAQTKMREMWEASLGVMRSNAQAMVQANARTLELWSSLFHK